MSPAANAGWGVRRQREPGEPCDDAPGEGIETPRPLWERQRRDRWQPWQGRPRPRRARARSESRR
eukprot:10818700-Alexandrium_andersonii.AAC.1